MAGLVLHGGADLACVGGGFGCIVAGVVAVVVQAVRVAAGRHIEPAEPLAGTDDLLRDNRPGAARLPGGAPEDGLVALDRADELHRQGRTLAPQGVIQKCEVAVGAVLLEERLIAAGDVACLLAGVRIPPPQRVDRQGKARAVRPDHRRHLDPRLVITGDAEQDLRRKVADHRGRIVAKERRPDRARAADVSAVGRQPQARQVAHASRYTQQAAVLVPCEAAECVAAVDGAGGAVGVALIEGRDGETARCGPLERVDDAVGGPVGQVVLVGVPHGAEVAAGAAEDQRYLPANRRAEDRHVVEDVVIVAGELDPLDLGPLAVGVGGSHGRAIDGRHERPADARAAQAAAQLEDP